MAGIVNFANCAVQSLSVGLNFDCDVKRERVMGAIIAPAGFEVPTTNLDSWEEILEYFQQAAAGGVVTGGNFTELPMVYPLTRPFFGAVDNTEEPTPITSGYGNTYGYTDSPKQFQLELDNYGVQWWKQLQAVNGGNWSVYLIDKTFIEGQLTSTGWAGFDANLYADKPRYDGVNGTRHYLNVSLTNPLAMGTISDVVQFPYDGYDLSQELNGNVALVLDFVGSSSGGTAPNQWVEARYRILTASGRENFGASNLTGLAIPSSWDIRNSAGVAITTFTGTFNEAEGSFAIRVTVPPATAAQGITFALAPPARLIANGMGTFTAGSYQSNKVRRSTF